MKWKVYATELVTGSKGTIAIPADKNLKDVMMRNEFLEDYFSELVIRSSALAKFQFIRYEDTDMKLMA